MSGFSRVLFGEKSRPAQAVDTTPEEYRNLRGGVADFYRRAMSPTGYTGPYSVGMGAGEEGALNGVAGAAGGIGGPNAGSDALARFAGGVMNPYARLSRGEQYGQRQVMNQAYGSNPMLDAARYGALNPNGLENTISSQLQQIGSGGPNPMVDRLIESASRPILENFTDQALAQRGLYNSAGQNVNPGGSSPFAQASARLSGNVAGALKDVGVGVAANEQQRQLQALQAGQGMLGLNLQRGQFAEDSTSNAFSRAMQGLDAAGLNRRVGSDAYENSANRSLSAGGTLNSQTLAGQMSALEGQLKNLQAQGLPRMIAQQGLDSGLNQFNTEQGRILQLMQLMAGITQPNTAVLPGQAGSQGAFQQFVGGFGQGLGGAIGMSDRRAKKNVQGAGTLPNGIPLHRFRYLWEGDDAPLRIGVMADEVEPILPDAVHRFGAGQLAFVDYSKVLGA